MSARREHPGKQFVMVRADHPLDGSVRPLVFRAEGGEPVRIDRVLSAREAPSLKVGGQGMRYVCRVGGRTVTLFHDDAYWFLETPFTPSPFAE